jgi:hypothetical protein
LERVRAKSRLNFTCIKREVLNDSHIRPPRRITQVCPCQGRAQANDIDVRS